MTKSASKLLREKRKAEMAVALFRAVAQEDVALDELGESCGVSKAVAFRWTNRNSERAIDAAAIAMAPRPIAKAMLREIAGHLGLVVSETPSEAQDIGTLHQVVRTMSKFEATYAEASEDNHFSGEELAAIERQATEVFELTVRVLNAIKERRREASSPVRVVK